MKSHEYDAVNRIIDFIFEFFHPTEDEKLNTLARMFFANKGCDGYKLKKIPFHSGLSKKLREIAPVDPDCFQNRTLARRAWVSMHLGFSTDSQVEDFRESIARGDSIEPYINRIRARLSIPAALNGRPRGRADRPEITPLNQT